MLSNYCPDCNEEYTIIDEHDCAQCGDFCPFCGSVIYRDEEVIIDEEEEDDL